MYDLNSDISTHFFQYFQDARSVGFIPTFLIVISLFGVIEPATRKKAADEMSPGTLIVVACKRLFTS